MSSATPPTSAKPPSHASHEYYTGDTPSLSVLVYRAHLRSSNDNALPKSNFLSRRKYIRTWKRVLIEPSQAGTKDSLFYAPDVTLASSSAHAPRAQFTKCMPAAPGVVQATDAFEIKFVGMNVAPQDCVARNDNELLLYSLTRDTHPAAAASTPPQPSDTDVPGAMRAADRARGVSSLGVDLCGEMLTGSEARGMRRATSSMRASTYKAPAGFAPSPSDVPFIHFDPAIDGHGSGTETDAFVPIPASKSVYMRHVGGGKAEDEGETVNVRFSVMEIDRISDGQLRAIAGIGEVGGYVEGQAGLPYMQLVSGALNMATFLGESALKKYSKPDHVLSKDVEFLLGDGESEAQTGSASETETGAAHVGNYLRYGYYFFLSKPVDACLYAQTGSSSQHVTLLMRRRGYTEKHARKNEKEFFPLTGVSYVVVKVSKGVRRREGEVRSVMEVDHRKRLENLLYMGNALEMLKKNVEKGSWWRPKMLTRSGKKV